MGGASSRFEQTQWWNADGELGNTDNEGQAVGGDLQPTIIPNVSPTAALEIFDILKSKSITSQRDFEVRDGRKNVIYITRTVPGTLAWFDVLRPGISEHAESLEEGEDLEDSHSSWGEDILEETTQQAVQPPTNNSREQLLLRVQVDWDRRTWMVYSYTPAFSGQLPAQVPDRKAIADGLKLYKSCCITMSWSRSMALATRFGPPTKLQDFWEDGDEDEIEHPLEEKDGEATTRDSEFISKVLFTKADTIAAKSRKEHNVDEEQLKRAQQTTPTKSKGEKADGLDESGSIIGGLFKSFMPMEEPAKPHLTKTEKRKLSLEGVVDLDAPRLHCQAVLHSKGNFQTLEVSKEQSVKLWMLDDAYRRSRESKPDETDQSNDPVKNPLGKAMAYEQLGKREDGDMDELKQWFTSQYVDAEHAVSKTPPVSPAAQEEGQNGDSRRAMMAKTGKSWFSFRMAKDETHNVDGTETTSESVGTIEDDSSVATKEDDESLDPSKKVYGSKGGIVDAEDDSKRKEPLVAHWRWKNTYTTHKMQMHLAKNSDLALHVVLSIIVNICRYESWW